MNAIPFITVGYDGSPDSRRALSWAATIAPLRHEAIVAAIVVDPKDNPRGVAWPESWWEEIEDRARGILNSVPGLEYRIERHVGNEISTLIKEALGASMMVVGSHGHSLAGEIFLGSVSQSLARHAAVPVIVVREPQTADAGRIVVGVDSSAASTQAFEFACQIAELTGEKVFAVHAWQPTTVPMDSYGYSPAIVSGPVDEQEATLDGDVNRMRAAHPSVAIHGDVIDTTPALALVEASRDASLVVVGSHGLNAVAEAVVGSVSHSVLHKAHCPVAVVK